MTGGVLGTMTKVGYSLASPMTWVKLQSLLNVVIPGLEPDVIDTSIHGSFMKRHMPGMTGVSDMEITILMDLDIATSPEQDALFVKQAAGTTIYWRVEVPNQRGVPSSWTPFTFQGWVKGFKPGAPMGDKQTLVISVVFDDVAFTKGPAGASVLG